MTMVNSDLRGLNMNMVKYDNTNYYTNINHKQNPNELGSGRYQVYV